ncbi:MAG TPA: hypothetical protein VG796_09625 [Verrucomicrobiales bacterium]|nr:hypothetical protein [Verrucomicrobiales bacterium]
MDPRVFLEKLEVAASNPYAVIALLCVLGSCAYLVFIRYTNNRHLQVLKVLPKEERSAIAKRGMDTIPRKGISGEQWIRSKKHLLVFLVLIVIFVLLAIVAIRSLAVSETRESNQSKATQMERARRDRAAVVKQRFRQGLTIIDWFLESLRAALVAGRDGVDEAVNEQIAALETLRTKYAQLSWALIESLESSINESLSHELTEARARLVTVGDEVKKLPGGIRETIAKIQKFLPPEQRNERMPAASTPELGENKPNKPLPSIPIPSDPNKPPPTDGPVTQSDSIIRLPAASAKVTEPFALAGGAVSQQILTTDAHAGGKALLEFKIPFDGNYGISATVDAPQEENNSFFISIDTEPEAPAMIWDIALTKGFEKRRVSWRGNGTESKNQFTPRTFFLTAGKHQLIIRGREGNTAFSEIEIYPSPAPPKGLRINSVRLQ